MFCPNCGKALPADATVCDNCHAGLAAVPTETSRLLRRAEIFISEEYWEKADEYCEKVLDLDPENAYAYVLKLMISLQIKDEAALASGVQTYTHTNFYKNAVRFANETLREKLEGYAHQVELNIKQKEEEAQQQQIAEALLQQEHQYSYAVYNCHENATDQTLNEALSILQSMPTYKDAQEKAEQCQAILSARKEKRLQEELEQQAMAEEEAKKKRLLTSVAAAIALIIIILFCVVKSNSNAEKAVEIANNLVGRSFTATTSQFGSISTSGTISLAREQTQTETTYKFVHQNRVEITTITRSDHEPFITVNGERQWDNISKNTDYASGYEVRVPLFGSATLHLDGKTFVLAVDNNNRPTSMTNSGTTFNLS